MEERKMMASSGISVAHWYYKLQKMNRCTIAGSCVHIPSWKARGCSRG